MNTKTKQFLLPQRFQHVKVLGKGAYGKVVAAWDQKDNKMVAIKKIHGIRSNRHDAFLSLNEIQIMNHMNHPNLTKSINTYGLLTPRAFNDIYIIMDHMEADLHKIIHSKQKLTNAHIRHMMFQIIKGVIHLHSSGIIHCDLKPSNIFVNGNCDVKIGDFGLSRSFVENQGEDVEEYVVTRWYRAPEVMCSDYNEKLDMWSLGCIMGEFHGRKAMFRGDDYMQQLELIFDVMGTPSDEDIKSLTNERAVAHIHAMKKIEKTPLMLIYEGADPLAIDLMEQLLMFNPKKRISAIDAYYHPYFDPLRSSDTNETHIDHINRYIYEEPRFPHRIILDQLIRYQAPI